MDDKKNDYDFGSGDVKTSNVDRKTERDRNKLKVDPNEHTFSKSPMKIGKNFDEKDLGGYNPTGASSLGEYNPSGNN